MRSVQLSAALLALTVAAHAGDYAVGADLSFLKQAEDRGTAFRENGEAKPGLRIFRDHGYNWIRLRPFHTPTELPNDLPYTISMARAARQLGFRFLLDFHYSDTWADPGKQGIPKAWAGLGHEQLTAAVFAYTRDSIAAFRQAGVLPDMVQIGNEVSNGMLWPDAKLPENWDHFSALVRAGIRGVEAGSAGGAKPRIMIHIDKGGDREATKRFFDRFHSYGIAYDIIGQSYYPWWHGSLLDLQANLQFMAETYGKEIILVEVAYNCRPGEYLKQPGPFPETPDGQRDFLDEVHRLVLATPKGLGRGVFWWEPAVTGELERRGFFDGNYDVLPVITVFDRWMRH